VSQPFRFGGLRDYCTFKPFGALERRRRRPDPRKFAPSIVELPDLFSGGAELSREALAYLATLPSHWSTELAGVRVAMWHARPGSDMEGIRADATGPALRRQLLDQAAADVLIVGHTHDALSLVAGKGRILNPGACWKTYAFKQEGSLSVPDGYRPATFGVLELPSKRFRLFRSGAERIPRWPRAAAPRCRTATGLPRWMRTRPSRHASPRAPELPQDKQLL
jgi:predicted phosphodiesterase